MLRRERRRAFHDARGPEGPTRPAAPPPASAGAVERELAAGLARLAQAHALATWAPELRQLAAEAATMAEEAGSPDAAGLSAAAPEASLLAMRGLAERAAELYLAAADGAHEEAALLRLQSLADRAIARIARLAAVAAEG